MCICTLVLLVYLPSLAFIFFKKSLSYTLLFCSVVEQLRRKEELHLICVPNGCEPGLGKLHEDAYQLVLSLALPFSFLFFSFVLKEPSILWFCNFLSLCSCMSQLLVECGVGIAVLVRCFVDKKDTENLIAVKLGAGFSRAPFATIVVHFLFLSEFYSSSQIR